MQTISSLLSAVMMLKMENCLAENSYKILPLSQDIENVFTLCGENCSSFKYLPNERDDRCLGLGQNY